MCSQVRLSTVILLALAFCLNGICRAATDPDSKGEEPAAGKSEVAAFLADLTKRPLGEQKKLLDALIARLPPKAAPGDPVRAKRLLLAALNKSDDTTGSALRSALPEKVAPIAIDALARGTPRGRAAAADLIYGLLVRGAKVELFRPALPSLRKAVVSNDKNLRAYSIYALRRMGADGVQGLMAALVAPEPFHWKTAVFIADYPDVAVPELKRALEAGDPTRRNALLLIKRMAPAGKEIVPVLLPLLDDKDAETRATAAFVVGLYGSAARRAVPRLFELIVADEPEVRKAASGALGRIGIESGQIERLWAGVLCIDKEKSNYGDFYNFGYAAASPGRAAVPALIKALSHPDARIRRTATYACGYLGPVAASAARPLLNTASDPDAETVMGSMWALSNLGSTAAPVAEGLVKSFEDAEFGFTRAATLYFEPRGAAALAEMGPTVLPALYKGLTSDNIMVQAGCAKALGKMDRVESRGAVTRLLKLFDETKDHGVRLVVLEALVAAGAKPNQLLPRLRPLVPPDERDGVNAARRFHMSSLVAFARWYLASHKDKKAIHARFLGRSHGHWRNPLGYDPADFTWGRVSGGLQVGVYVAPVDYVVQRRHPDVHRLVVAVRNVGERTVVLPEPSYLYGMDVRVTEVPDVLTPFNRSFHRPPGLRELRPGQMATIRPVVSYQLAYGRQNAHGRWAPFTCENKDYHVTVTLRGIGPPDPPHLPCYATEAIRKECWQGEVTSGSIATRLHSAEERERAKAK